RSPCYDRMAAHGAVFGSVYGWERPNWFSPNPGAEAEETFRRANWSAMATRADAAVGDDFDGHIVALGHPHRFILYRTSIGIDIDRHHSSLALAPSLGTAPLARSSVPATPDLP
ncbi:MAG: hypothetical protein AAFW98_11400, partial [Pseudomonadota bacterium]